MVLLSVGLNFFQTYRSQQAAARLRHQVAPTATVFRDGEWVDVPRRDLVPGDVNSSWQSPFNPGARSSAPVPVKAKRKGSILHWADSKQTAVLRYLPIDAGLVKTSHSPDLERATAPGSSHRRVTGTRHESRSPRFWGNGGSEHRVDVQILINSAHTGRMTDHSENRALFGPRSDRA